LLNAALPAKISFIATTVFLIAIQSIPPPADKAKSLPLHTPKSKKIPMKKFLLLLLFICPLQQLIAQSGTAVQLDGINDYVTTGNNPYTNADLDTGSMAIWFKTSANPNSTQLMSCEGYTNIALDPSGQIVGCSDGSCTSSLVASALGFNNNQWHFVVLTWQTNVDIRLYVDGTLVDQGVPLNSPNVNALTRAMTFGIHPAFAGDYFNGQLDEASIWSKKLSPAEVTSLMNNCITGNEPRLLGYWKFNTGSGTTDPDLTTHGTNLTLVNGTTWVTSGILSCCVVSTSSQSFTICQGDNIVVGGNTYTTSGTYHDTLTAISGCDSIVTTVLSVTPSSTFSQSVSFCAGGSITVGSNTYTSSGNYADTLTASSGCDSIINTSLTVFALPNVQYVSPVDTFCIGDAVYTLTGGSPAGGMYSGNGVSSGQFNAAVAGVGTHQVTYVYTDVNGCTDSDATAFYVDVCTAIPESTMQTLMPYPNPAATAVTVVCPPGTAFACIVNSAGQTVLRVPRPAGQHTFDLSGLPAGLYAVYCYGNGQVAKARFICTK
jgi:hypothetical protein